MTDESESMETTNDESQKPESQGRMQILDHALSQARKKIISSAKLQLFQKHLRPIHKKNPEVLKRMHMQLTKQLDCHISEEVMLMFAEEQMEKILDDLDGVIASQKDNKEEAWRPSGDPQQDSRVYNISVKVKQKAQLQHVLSQLEQQNTLLRDHVALRQKKLLGTKRTVDSGISKWREINEAATSIPADELVEFVQKYGKIHRHHTMIPWDDDIDVLVNGSQKEAMSRALESLPEYTLYRPPLVQWKFFSKNITRSKRPFAWPYIDIFFFGENETHIWDKANRYTQLYMFRKADVFPLQNKPYQGSLQPVPCNSPRVLSRTYDPTLCTTSSYTHKEERSKDPGSRKTVKCESLYRKFPFVFRETRDHYVMETVKVGDCILYQTKAALPCWTESP
ncbi:uncharacterized protein LOC117333919 [Pecten maximus]|uniref:uncharacterized protein LOC117333919 n=1 Tax=Pecten maximus TaxID=6579 RepID=UPI0014581491|nr:uncharacterized protein LOC117333919 [Pecten maximus]